jgi:Bacterial nucleoid DNA-binding protein
MAVFYKKTQRRNPMDPSAPKKWYCVLRRVKKALTKDVAAAAAEKSMASPKEIELSIVNYFQIIVNLLKDGRSVEIENFGTFRLTVSVQGADTAEEFNANYINQANIRFIPSKSLRGDISDITYIDADDFSKDTPPKP